MQKIPTLYDNYQELMLDLDIYGKITAIPTPTLDELKDLYFDEFKQRKPFPTLEGKRYELSDLVSPEYKIAYSEMLELSENETLVDFGSTERIKVATDISFEDLTPLLSSVTEMFSYENSIKDSDRNAIIQKYDLASGEEFKQGVLQTEKTFGSVIEDTSTILTDEEIDNLGSNEELSSNEEVSYEIEDYSEEEGVEYNIEGYSEYSEDDESESGFDEDSDEDELDDSDFNSEIDDEDSEDDELEDDEDSEEEDDSEEDYEDDDYDEDFDEDGYDEESDDEDGEDSEEYYEDDESEDEDDFYDDEEDELEDDSEEDYEDDSEDDSEEEDDSEDESDEYDSEEDYDEEDDSEDDSEDVDNLNSEESKSGSTYNESEEVDAYLGDLDEGLSNDFVVEDSEVNDNGGTSEDFDIDDEMEFISEENLNKVVETPTTPAQVSQVNTTQEQTVRREEEPTDLRKFLRKHPRCDMEFALQYFSKKEINDAIKIGRIIKKDGKLRI